MKRRVRKIVNFFAFNLLFFALYLNFIHKDNVNPGTSVATDNSAVQKAAAFSGTVLVQSPEKTDKKANQPVSAAENTAQPLSVN